MGDTRLETLAMTSHKTPFLFPSLTSEFFLDLLRFVG